MFQGVCYVENIEGTGPFFVLQFNVDPARSNQFTATQAFVPLFGSSYSGSVHTPASIGLIALPGFEDTTVLAVWIVNATII